MQRNQIRMPRWMGREVKELADRKDQFQNDFMRQLITELANELPEIKDLKQEGNIRITVDGISPHSWRKILRYCALNSTTPGEEIKRKIKSILRLKGQQE